MSTDEQSVGRQPEHPDVLEPGLLAEAEHSDAAEPADSSHPTGGHQMESGDTATSPIGPLPDCRQIIYQLATPWSVPNQLTPLFLGPNRGPDFCLPLPP